MSDKIEPNKSFEERMMDRIRDSIGDLMTKEDLKKIVEKGIDKSFFERPQNVNRGWRSELPETLPSVADKIVEAHFKVQMREALNGWLKEHDDDVKNAIAEALRMGLANCVLHALTRHVQETLQIEVQNAVRNALTSSGIIKS